MASSMMSAAMVTGSAGIGSCIPSSITGISARFAVPVIVAAVVLMHARVRASVLAATDMIIMPVSQIMPGAGDPVMIMRLCLMAIFYRAYGKGCGSRRKGRNRRHNSHHGGKRHCSTKFSQFHI